MLAIGRTEAVFVIIGLIIHDFCKKAFVVSFLELHGIYSALGCNLNHINSNFQITLMIMTNFSNYIARRVVRYNTSSKAKIIHQFPLLALLNILKSSSTIILTNPLKLTLGCHRNLFFALL